MEDSIGDPIDLSLMREQLEMERQERQLDRERLHQQLERERAERLQEQEAARLERQQDRDQINEMIKLMSNMTAQQNVNTNQTSLMASLTTRLPKFTFDLETSQTFPRWYSRHGAIIADEGALLSEPNKVRLLLGRLEDDLYDQYTCHIAPDDPYKRSLDDTVKTLSAMFDIKRSQFALRYECLQLHRQEDEQIQAYFRRINDLCEKAKLKDIDNDTWKVLLGICGLKSPKDSHTRAILLSFLERRTEDNLATTLSDLLVEYEKVCTRQSDAQRIEKRDKPFVNAVSNPREQTRTSPKFAKPQTACWNCGKGNHSAKVCRQSVATCEKCNTEGHCAKMCDTRSKILRAKQNRSKTPSKRSNAILANALTEQVQTGTRKFITVHVNEQPVQFQVDTGSDITLIGQEEHQKIGSPQLEPASITVKNASGDNMKLLGRFHCQFQLKGSSGTGYVYVRRHGNLLGLDFIVQSTEMSYYLERMVNSSQVADSAASVETQLKTRFPTVFEPGLGRCTKQKVHLRIAENSRPVFCQKRPVPYAALETVEKELQRLLNMNVIEPVTHSEWAAPIVTLKKSNGTTRVCADFKTGLNRALVDEEYPLPTPEDIFANLNGGIIYSQIDFSDAYLQLELSEQSKDLVVINTHKGLFRYNRLPFGVKVAPKLFQKLIDSMISGLEGTIAYLDDLIVMGRSHDEHENNLFKLFERIEEFGFRVRLEKCAFSQQQIKYLGYIVDKDGRRPDPAKIAAITSMPPPQNEKQLYSFLGMVTYYSHFIPNLKPVRAVLDRLLQKEVEWRWSKVEEDAFATLIRLLSSDLNLTHFDPTLPVVVAADASDYGIGAVLSHRFQDGTEKPIYHATKSLTSAQQKYSQIEKEGLALVFAIKRFHKFLFGRKFLLRTDHKPLLAIFGSKKGVPVHSQNRLVRWAIILLGYDFEIEHVRTEDFGHADALSRLINQTPFENEDVVIAHIENDVAENLAENIRRLPVTAADIREATRKDQTLTRLFPMIQSGRWPRTVPEEWKPFHKVRDQLSVVNDCILYEHRVMIPEALRKRVLKELHNSHPGICRMKQLARSLVYWPKIDTDIDELVRRCEPCQLQAKAPVKVPLVPWPNATSPWQRIHVDFAGPDNGKMYMIVVDAFSKYPEVVMLQSTTAKVTVRNLMTMFSRYGFPEVIVSDNGTQFTSGEFKRMCSENGIQHMTTAPYAPYSNGQAERFVDTLKRSLAKLKGEGVVTQEMLDQFLQVYRYSPCAAIEYKSPAELFLGRKLRTRLSLVSPSNDRPSTRSSYTETMKDQYDTHHGVRNKAFQVGDPVLAQVHSHNKWSWKPGTIASRLGSVHYLVKLADQKVKRHANQLKHSSLNPEVSAAENYWLNIMLDTFALYQRPNVAKQEHDNELLFSPRTTNSPVVTPKPILKPHREPKMTEESPTRDAVTEKAAEESEEPLRRSTRQRRPVIRFQAGC